MIKKQIATHLIISVISVELERNSPNPKTPKLINKASENAQIVQTRKT
jgi:hypothetical protein